MASMKPQASSLRVLILAPTISESSNTSKDVRPSLASLPLLLPTFLQALTNSAPSPDLTTFAGYTSHPPLNLRTRYYAADVNLWCDELPSLPGSTGNEASDELFQWKTQMLSTEAEEVRAVIGGIIILLPFNAPFLDPQQTEVQIKTNMQYIAAANEVRDQIDDESGRDVATIVVVQDVTPSAAAERNQAQNHGATIHSFAQKFEDSCVSDHGMFGWDIVAWQPHTQQTSKNAIEVPDSTESTTSEVEKSDLDGETNEYGEKLGIARVVEVLEQTNWLNSTLNDDHDEHEAGYDLVSTDDFFDLDDDEDDDFSMPSIKPKIVAGSRSTGDPITTQSDEFQREIMGLHFALEEQNQRETNSGEGEDFQVEQLTGLMERVAAIKEAASEMPSADRKTFARREVGRIMKEMNVG
ncbi:hypothetical protein H2198_001130 [Neophaeococcomyces mojaviensis]|uniref:Uncharacterized protein n=1 Tax=Neophaeococcomyces mojaviensis TaxID=3383035 RepID=A0ACC3AHY8_9EURO|nr:hypothetical protein H2198_001130 [Knufia sp. JES_112]